VALAGDEAGQNWDVISGYLYQLLGESTSLMTAHNIKAINIFKLILHLILKTCIKLSSRVTCLQSAVFCQYHCFTCVCPVDVLLSRWVGRLICKEESLF